MLDDMNVQPILSYEDKSTEASMHSLNRALYGRYTLISGYPLTDDLFDYQMSQLARSGFRTISLELCGFSQIKSPIEVYNYKLVSHDISAISKYLDLNAVKLQGRSVGGAVAIHYAVIKQGRLVNKLALFAAPANSNSIPAYNLSSTDAASNWNSIEEIEGPLPSSPGALDLSLAQSETLINVGVATWFLYQGHHSA